MLKDMPMGPGEWEAAAWCAACTEGGALPDDWFGILEVDLDVPQGVSIPILGEKKETRSGEKLIFDNTYKRHYVLFSEQLRFALERGVTLRRVHRALRFERYPLFEPYVRVWQRVKEQQAAYKASKDPVEKAKYNEALYCAVKLLLNAPYGRCLFNQVMTESTLVRRSDLHKLASHAFAEKLVDLEPLPDGEHFVCSIAKKPKLNTHLPPSCGVAILGYAQTRLYEMIEACERAGGLPLYCDTDSLVYLTAPGADLGDEWFHDSEFGLTKDELPEPKWGVIKGFCALASKVYSFLFANAEFVADDSGLYFHMKGCSL